MSKLILLNSPPNSGKTVLTQHLKAKYGVQEARCKDKLFTLTYELFNVQRDTFFRMYEDREQKESPNSLFAIPNEDAYKLSLRLRKQDLTDRVKWAYQNGSETTPLTLREAMIFVSEVVAKPIFGKDYFGKCRAENLQEGVIYADDSAAFVDEVTPAIMKLGMDNILLIRIHGRGTFDGDSRSYIPDGVIKNTVDIQNDGTLEEFIERADSVVAEFLGG